MTAPNTRDPRALLRDCADHPSAFLAMNHGTHHHLGVRAPGVIAYRMRGRRAVQLGGPFAAPEHRGTLLDEFRDALPRPGRPLTVAQLRTDDVSLYEARGFTVNQFGSTYAIDLQCFTMRGKALAKIRQNTSRARREGVTVEEASADSATTVMLDAIDVAWLRDKGRHVKKLDFLVGERGGAGERYRRTFLARHHGKVVAYLTYSPAYGRRPGWLYDLTRRAPDAPVGTVELLNLTALLRFQDEGAPWLHLGLTPLAGLDPRHEPSSSSRVLNSALTALAKRGQALYPARTQEAFKLKWAPHVIEPEYLAFEGGASVPSVWNLLRITRAV
ncbi:DUF2156 domain-containing protein [Streptomyces sp. NPDC047071]|uniref:bifunctional lysylphosphatidylglycerol flippase/synthetase MprF n=1 Tax=Streptomyces sp. NPDC047071 TaxID=3154808 RepID=UPI0034538B9A